MQYLCHLMRRHILVFLMLSPSIGVYFKKCKIDKIVLELLTKRQVRLCTSNYSSQLRLPSSKLLSLRPWNHLTHNRKRPLAPPSNTSSPAVIKKKGRLRSDDSHNGFSLNIRCVLYYLVRWTWDMYFIIWYFEHETCSVFRFVMAFYCFGESNGFYLIMRYLFYYPLICNGCGPVYRLCDEIEKIC